MDRREKLLTALCGKDLDGNSVKYADATIKLILGDMGKEYIKFWEIEGPGAMCFQPNNTERTMFWLTLSELHSAKEDAESSNNEDLSESFRRILESVQKIDPTAGAGYILNDHQGMRYFYIDYNKESE
jgi:hypothetical protein|tara:strand:+ start:4016 stop:4399 length:384 start_codon:yes stop_codon:yes gene_type:complete